MSQRHEYRLPPFDRLRSTSSTSSAAIKRPQEIAHFSYVPHTPLPSNAPCPSNLRHYGSTLDPPPTHASHSQDGQSRHNSSSRVEKEADSNSHSRSRVLHHDARAIKYYYSPEIGASLSEGFESFQQLDNEEDEHLDGLLACVSHLEMLRRGGDGLQRGERVFEDSDGGTTQGGHRDWKIKPDFMTWRGMMTKIMAAPYSNFDGSVVPICDWLSYGLLARLLTAFDSFEMNATLFDVR